MGATHAETPAPAETIVVGHDGSDYADEASAKVARVLQRDTAAHAGAHPTVNVDYRAKFGQPAAVLIGTRDAEMLAIGA